MPRRLRVSPSLSNRIARQLLGRADRELLAGELVDVVLELRRSGRRRRSPTRPSLSTSSFTPSRSISAQHVDQRQLDLVEQRCRPRLDPRPRSQRARAATRASSTDRRVERSGRSAPVASPAAPRCPPRSAARASAYLRPRRVDQVGGDHRVVLERPRATPARRDGFQPCPHLRRRSVSVVGAIRARAARRRPARAGRRRRPDQAPRRPSRPSAAARPRRPQRVAVGQPGELGRRARLATVRPRRPVSRRGPGRPRAQRLLERAGHGSRSSNSRRRSRAGASDRARRPSTSARSSRSRSSRCSVASCFEIRASARRCSCRFSLRLAPEILSMLVSTALERRRTPASSCAAVLSPMPGTPGMLSEVSPLSPMKSGTSSGGMP